MIKKTLTTFLALVLLLTGPLSAQLTEVIEVRVTNVDVVVTDSKGNPISGLTRDDFLIEENGKPQPVTNFYEVRPKSVNTRITAADAVQEPGYAEAPRELRQRKVIFFIDNWSLHPNRRNEVFTAIEKAIDRILQPGDQAMMVTWNRGLHVIVPFSPNLAHIKEGLHQYAKTNAGGVPNEAAKDRIRVEAQDLLEMSQGRRPQLTPQEAYAQATSIVRTYSDDAFAIERSLLSSVTVMLSSLAGLEGKKVLVFAGAELPQQPGRELFQWVDQLFAPSIPTLTPGANRESSERSLGPALEKIAERANANGVTLYMIDAADNTKGLLSSSDSNSLMSPETDFIEFTNTANSFNSVARATGGIGLARTNNFEFALNTVARDLDAYYSLGYKPETDDAQQRKIRVRLKGHPELRVRTRGSYKLKSSEDQINDRVIANIFNPSLKNELRVGIATGPPVKMSRNTYRVPVQVTIPSDLTLLPEGNMVVGGFHIYVAVGNATGAMSAVSKRSQTIRVPATAERAMRSKPLIFNTQVIMERGEHFLSIGVVDQLTSATGFARATVALR